MAAPLIPIAMALAQVAPQIVRWMSGSDKAAEVAERVVDVAKAVTGTDDPEAAVQMVQADPALAVQFQTRIAELSADLDKEFLKDRQDARARDIELARLGRTNTRANFMVAMDVLGLLFGFVSMLVLGWYKATYPNEINEGVFGVLLAQLSTITSYFGLCLRDAHQFEFGSSRGSRLKDEERATRGG